MRINANLLAYIMEAIVHFCGKRMFGAAAAAKSHQLCPTLCLPIDSSPPGSSVPGILQARTLEWVAISFSNAWKWKVKGKLLRRAWLLATPWTAAHQAPLSMGFSNQEYWSGVPLPSPMFGAQTAYSLERRIRRTLPHFILPKKKKKIWISDRLSIKKNCSTVY